ncbi:MAG: stage II sporulation protein P [Clostridia bacterium]|nr:stage II sporulation protein P [Clostridia bacterium]
MKTEPLNILQKVDFLPALPPPKDSPPQPKVPRKATYGKFFRALCSTTAIMVIGICAFQKIDAIYQKGVVEYFSEGLLCLSNNQSSICNSISVSAFGSGAAEVTDATSATEVQAVPKTVYIPKKENIKLFLPENEADEETVIQNNDIYAYDLSTVPKGYYPIIPTDTSAKNKYVLKNDTSYTIDMVAVSKKEKNFSAPSASEEPLVLIVHTHGTESFSSEEYSYYSENFNHPRSEDTSKNVVAVGKTLCDALNEKGIPTIHCEIMHDRESYINAYDRSAESIRNYLEEYPSIQYVFDVHRDSLIRSDLTKLRPVTLKDGSPCAQIMMIVGSDEKGAGEYDWESNLQLASAVQHNLFADSPSVARHIYLRGASYNQQYAKYGLLLEIGSCGNTLSEAKEAAKAFADAFEKAIR